jgi:hypothetical protein
LQIGITGNSGGLEVVVRIQLAAPQVAQYVAQIGFIQIRVGFGGRRAAVKAAVDAMLEIALGVRIRSLEKDSLNLRLAVSVPGQVFQDTVIVALRVNLASMGKVAGCGLPVVADGGSVPTVQRLLAQGAGNRGNVFDKLEELSPEAHDRPGLRNILNYLWYPPA